MSDVLKWLFDFVYEAGRAVSFIVEPFIDLGEGFTYTILSLVTIGGLTAYLTIALVKWLAS